MKIIISEDTVTYKSKRSIGGETHWRKRLKGKKKIHGKKCSSSQSTLASLSHPPGQGYILNENAFYDPEILLCLSLFILNFRFG